MILTRVLLTSGGTKVPIDPVRAITNMSAGTFGSRIAHQILTITDRFAPPLVDDFTFLCAKHSNKPFAVTVDPHAIGSYDQWERVVDLKGLYDRTQKFYREVEFRDFEEYAALLDIQMMLQPDLIILAAAVSDYLVVNPADHKVRSSEQLAIELKPAPKLIATIRERCPKTTLVGFKLLVDSSRDELLAAARLSIETNGCDLVVANDLEDIREGNHKVMLVTAEEEEIYEFRPDDPEFLAQVVAATSLKMAAQKIKGKSPKLPGFNRAPRGKAPERALPDPDLIGV